MGKRQRNLDIEMLRGIAILLILFYHYTQIIPGIMNTHWLQMIDEGFCQMAMIMFFSISGFGSYVYLFKHRDGKALSYVKKRFRAIAPQYYFCLVVLLLTVSANFLAWNQILRVSAFFAFVQNLFASTNTMINGATWTIALMMQFYLIAPLVYKLVQKYGVKFYVLSICVTFLIRMLVSLYIRRINGDSFLFVVYSIRQIYTTFDIFVGGMIVGKNYMERERELNAFRCRWGVAIVFLSILGSFMVFTYTPSSNYVWGANVRSWMWPAVLGIEVAFLLHLCTGIKLKYQSIGGKFIQFIAKNEYGIYLWHMPLISTISVSSPMYAGALERSPEGTLIVMGMLAIMVGKGSNDLLNRFVKKNLDKVV